jgi:hypothetical protein
MNQPVQHVVVNVENKSNGFGLAGLIFSCIGWLTCGALCIPGAFLSFIGLFFKPRGTAIAGLIVGFPGVIFFAVVGMGMLAGILGIGAAATGAVEQAREAARRASEQNQINAEQISEPAQPVESKPEEPSQAEVTMPTPIETNPVVETKPTVEAPPAIEQPEPKVDPTTIQRTFSDASGKFKVEATVVSYGAGQVSLKRADTGKIVTIDASKLCEEDQKWLNETFK